MQVNKTLCPVWLAENNGGCDQKWRVQFKENSAYLSAVASRHAHLSASGAVKIAPGRYITQKGAFVAVSEFSRVVEIDQKDGKRITINLSRLADEISTGSVVLTPVSPDAEAA